MPWGYRAMFVLLHTYRVRHGCRTLREMISRYAPPMENHTENYIRAVAAGAQVSPDEPLDTKSGERHLHRVVGEEVETVTREYDTSRPVDTLTGTPPLRRETTQRRRLTDSTHEADRVRQTEHRIQADTILGGGHARQQLRTEGNTSRQEAAETDLTTAQRRGLTWWQHALCIAGLLVVAYGTYRLFKHR